MSTKAIIILLVVLALAVGVVYFFAKQSSAPTTSVAPAAGQGKVVVGISDAALAIDGVSSIMMTVDKVEVESATSGWVTVSSGSKQYDLLQLRKSGAVSLLSDINLPVGTYNQIRLDISRVIVTNTSGVSQDAKLPSWTLKIGGRLVVEEGKTTTVVLDFKADKSLHVTGNGKYIMAPVVSFQSKRDASVNRDSEDKLKISGGKVEDSVEVGMDEKGNVKNNFELDSTKKIEIDDKGEIHLGDQSNTEGGKSQNSGEVKLTLSVQNNSGIAGTATFESVDGGKTKVTLKLSAMGIIGIPGLLLLAVHPAHIHLGSCANLGAVKYPLTFPVNGVSETTLNVSMADLKAQLPLAINVHKSPAEAGVYISCADLKF